MPPNVGSFVDPVGISILDMLTRFGPFRATPRPDSDSGRSDLRFQRVRPHKIMKYVMFMTFQILNNVHLLKLKKLIFLQGNMLRNLFRIQDRDLSFQSSF